MEHIFTKSVMKQFKTHFFAKFCLLILFIFLLIAVYAPLLASSKPLLVLYKGSYYSPLLRYVFYPGFFTKALDRFFNLMMFTLPLFILCRSKKMRLFIVCLQILGFFVLQIFPVKDPAHKLEAFNSYPEEWEKAPTYFQINALVDQRRYAQQEQILSSFSLHTKDSIYNVQKKYLHEKVNYYKKKVQNSLERHNFKENYYGLIYLLEREEILNQEQKNLKILAMPLLRPFHFEEDAGGSRQLNQEVPWWELTRINRKDLVASLLFGTRISLVVGILAISVALVCAIPIGLIAGYFGGRADLMISRLLEVWESMPIFFMLLFVVAILESKSLLLVTCIIGVFGWTGLARFVRAESLKQRHLSYVDACRVQGLSESRTLFSHVLPNALPPLITLIPFSMMEAITSEAALSFLGLGEEGSCSWGVLMDEGRQAFPGESNLLWPPAALLTLLLISIAIVGDGLRDALDPKLRQ